LIQSYGSGIRRAKSALARIGSPALVFEPDHDTDDYTAVTVYINEEFARVKSEEEGRQIKSKDGNVVEKVVENVVEKLSPKAQNLVAGYSNKKRETALILIGAIRNNPKITIEEMALTIGATDRTVQRYLKEFQESDILKREGSDKKGEWILN
jgi:predicted HTH transcriptional regulator